MQSTDDPIEARGLPAAVAGLPAGQREHVLAAALSSIGSAVVVTDTSGTILWVNEAFATQSGYAFDEAVGATMRILRSGFQEHAYYAELWQTITSGAVWRGDMVERHKDGHFYTVTQTIAPIPDDDGQPAYFLAVHDDVTGLRTSQALFDEALDGILLLDDDARCLEANPAMGRLVGCDPADLTGMPLSSLLTPEERAGFEASWTRLRHDGQARHHHRLRHCAGGTVEVECRAVRDALPGVHLSVLRDVTAARAGEAERLFQSQLLAAVDEAVIATDTHGIVRYCNPAAEGLFACDASRAIQDRVDKVIPLASHVEGGHPLLDAAVSRTRWEGEIDVARPDGTSATLLATCSPYVDEGSELAGVIAVCRDVSDLKAAQRLLRHRASQHAALAELSRYALTADDLAAVAREAERTVVDLLGPQQWQAGVVWYADASSHTPLAPTGADVGAPIGSVGQLRAWTYDPVTLRPEDREFLRAVASLLDVAVERHKLRADLEHLATHDPLTGLPNRTLFLDRLEQAKARTRRDGGGYAVLLVDLDGFKQINDTHGHHVGDHMLRELGRRLRQTVREADTVARFGGDEFIVLVGDASEPAAAEQAARRVRDALTRPIDVGDMGLTVAASIGISIGDATTDADDLLRQADAAMYRAKADHRHDVAAHDDE